MAGVLILAIETATGCGSVALTRGRGDATGHVLTEFILQPELTHSRRLLGSVVSIMTAAGISWNELDGVAVSQGPGSFTGLRIGMAAAKGIAMAAGLPLLGIPTLDGLALQVPPIEQPICCLLDARKQQVYAAFYRHDGSHWCRSGIFHVLKPEKLVEHIHEPTMFIGPGLQACSPELKRHPMVRFAEVRSLHPRAATIGFLAGRMLMDGTEGNGREIVPLYVRSSEAELNLLSMNMGMKGVS